MRKIIDNREGTCKVMTNISGDTNFFRVSIRGEMTGPHIIIGSARNSGADRVRIRLGRVNGADPGFLDKDNVSSRGLEKGVSCETLSVSSRAHGPGNQLSQSRRINSASIQNGVWVQGELLARTSRDWHGAPEEN